VYRRAGSGGVDGREIGGLTLSLAVGLFERGTGVDQVKQAARLLQGRITDNSPPVKEFGFQYKPNEVARS
jgi:hypothetical protein